MGDLIDRIGPGQWTAPTPCTEWSVRDVVNHLAGMNLVFVALFEESPMPERGARAQLPSQPRAGRFADPQPIRDDAPPIDRLAAFTGRPVPWTP